MSENCNIPDDMLSDVLDLVACLRGGDPGDDVTFQVLWLRPVLSERGAVGVELRIDDERYAFEVRNLSATVNQCVDPTFVRKYRLSHSGAVLELTEAHSVFTAELKFGGVTRTWSVDNAFVVDLVDTLSLLVEFDRRPDEYIDDAIYGASLAVEFMKALGDDQAGELCRRAHGLLKQAAEIRRATKEVK